MKNNLSFHWNLFPLIAFQHSLQLQFWFSKILSQKNFVTAPIIAFFHVLQKLFTIGKIYIIQPLF